MKFMLPISEVMIAIQRGYLKLEKDDQRLADLLLNDVRFVVERLLEKEVSFP